MLTTLTYKIPDPIYTGKSTLFIEKRCPELTCKPTTKATPKEKNVLTIKVSRDASSSVPLINPILFSPLALRTSSGSLTLALNGNRSLSKRKLDPDRERPCSPLGVAPSSNSRALNESSESWEDLERSGDNSSSADRWGSRKSLGDRLIKLGDFSRLVKRRGVFVRRLLGDATRDPRFVYLPF